MDDGVIVEEGSADQVIGSPQHERTQSFLKRVLEPDHVTPLGHGTTPAAAGTLRSASGGR
jgi:polar amino acid transport system ATP-binding protein